MAELPLPIHDEGEVWAGSAFLGMFNLMYLVYKILIQHAL